MNVEWIKMMCQECGMKEFRFNETLGETECLSCGLIVHTEPFEQRVSIVNNGVLKHSKDKKNQLGSIITGKGSYKYTKRGNNTAIPTHITKALTLCKMVLASVAENSPLSDRVEEVYLELQKKNIFGNQTLENRATAVVHYVLRENKTPLPIKEITKEFNCNQKSVKKLVRKIGAFYKNRTIYVQADPHFLLSQTVVKITDDPFFLSLCEETMKALEPILERANYNKTPSYYACVAWITKNINLYSSITVSKISKATEIHRATIFKNTKNIIALLGYTDVKQMKGKKIKEE